MRIRNLRDINGLMLYTRKGDKGTTTTCNTGGGRIPKSSLLIEALGNIDELNAWLGLCKAKLEDDKIKKTVEEVQQNIFIIQAEIAGAKKSISKEETQALETVIDNIEKKLPVTTTFLIPGGTELSASFDVARTLARRAERRVIDATENNELKVSAPTKAYLNRLSSLLYAIERLLNKQDKVKEKAPSYK